MPKQSYGLGEGGLTGVFEATESVSRLNALGPECIG
jgi:hypothetical protein